MTRIDPARLSRLLSTLSGKRDRVEASAPPSTNAAQVAGSRKTSRNMNSLKARLRKRLGSLAGQDRVLAETGPTIAIQEILCWEFGDSIMEHAEFDHVVQQVVGTMMSNIPIATALAKLVQDLAASGET